MATAGVGGAGSDTRRSLVHRRVDGWLLGGLGVVAWLLVSPYALGGSVGPVGGWLGAAFLVVTSAHFGASYHLAYGGGRAELRKHPLPLVVAPALLLAASATILGLDVTGHRDAALGILRGLFITVFTLTGWHYIKQAYGVGMLAARGAGMRPSRVEALVLRYSLYPLWFVNLMGVWAVGRQASYRELDVSVGLVPGLLDRSTTYLAVAAVLVAAATMGRLALRARVLPPLGLWGAYATGALWFVMRPSYVSAAVVLAGIHAVQYLTCVHRAEVDWAVERGERQMVTWWVCLFGGAAAGGLLASSWLPQLLDGTVTEPTIPGLFGSLLFVGLNLHHYAIDATIWRSGGEHVVRISRGPRADAVAQAAPARVEPVAPTPAMA